MHPMATSVKSSASTDLLKTFAQHFFRYKSLVYQQYLMPIIRPELVLPQAKENGPDILVIEDNGDEWVLIRQALRGQFPMINLVWASSAVEVTTYFKRCLEEQRAFPHLILADLYLPTARLGLGLVKSLKTHRLFKTIPFITLADPAKRKT